MNNKEEQISSPDDHREGNVILQNPNTTRLLGTLITLGAMKLSLPLRLGGLAVGGYLALSGTPTVSEALSGFSSWKTRRRHLVIEKSVTINRPLSAVYGFFRDCSNLPSCLNGVEEAEPLNDERSDWHLRVKVPLPMYRSWYLRLTDIREGEYIAWHSLPQSKIQSRGSVRFKELPEHRGVEVKLTFAYFPGGGPLAYILAKLRKPVTAQSVKDELMRIKSLLETGEIANNKGQPHAKEVEHRQSAKAAEHN